MRVLVVDAYPVAHPDAAVAGAAVELARSLGNQVEHLRIADGDGTRFMSADEKRAYETEDPLVSDDTRAAAAAVRQSDAILFCYPTTLFGVPPVLKSWLERTMVLGVAFVFDHKRRIRPGLRNVTLLAVVTTSPHGRLRTWRARDGGHRTLTRSMRLNCHPRCRISFTRLRTGSDPSAVGRLRGLRWRLTPTD